MEYTTAPPGAQPSGSFNPAYQPLSQDGTENAGLNDPILPVQDSIDGGARPRVNVNYTLGPENDEQMLEETRETTRNLVTTFMVDYIENEGRDVPDELKERRKLINRRELARCAEALKRMGDQLANDPELNDPSLLEMLQVNSETVYEAFQQVAVMIFENGINWGRIVVLLCFGCRLALEVVDESLIIKITDWVIKYVIDILLHWIITKGGWASIIGYIESPTIDPRLKVGAALIAGFLGGLACSYYYRK